MLVIACFSSRLLWSVSFGGIVVDFDGRVASAAEASNTGIPRGEDVVVVNGFVKSRLLEFIDWVSLSIDPSRSFTVSFSASSSRSPVSSCALSW